MAGRALEGGRGIGSITLGSRCARRGNGARCDRSAWCARVAAVRSDRRAARLADADRPRRRQIDLSRWCRETWCHIWQLRAKTCVLGLLLHETWSSWPIFKSLPARSHNDREGNPQHAQGVRVFGVRPEHVVMIDGEVSPPMRRASGRQPVCTLRVHSGGTGGRIMTECPSWLDRSGLLLRMAA